MEIVGPIFVTVLVFSSPNQEAHKQVVLATYKQTGMEAVVNKQINYYVDKDYQKMVGYTYQIGQMIKNKEVTIGFSF